jgi:GATA-binding protein
MSMQRQAQQGQVKSQARQVPQRRQQSGHSTPAASPGHRQSLQHAMPIYQNPLAQNFPQMPSGPSRENSIYGNNGLSSISTTPNPMTPIENSFSSSVGRNFGPASFGNSFNSFGTSPYMTSGNGSTTPIEPPPGWGVSPVQPTDAFNWAHMPPQMSNNQQQGQMNNDMTDMLDPQVFNSLAELLSQSQNSSHQQPQAHQQQQYPTQQQQQESFDLLSALTHAQGQMQSQQPMSAQVGSENSNSASLLTRRMQQAQTHQQPQYSRPGSVGGSANGTPNTSSTPQYSSPSYATQQQSMLDPASMGQFPTPPQNFSTSFQQQHGRAIKSSSNPTTPWPLQDRQLGYSGTPSTTPGGSEYAYTSPVEVSLALKFCADEQNVPGPSRAPLPIQPRRREAPLPPAPTFHETPSQSGSFRSSYVPPHSSVQPGSQKSVSFKGIPEHAPEPVSQQPPVNGSGFSGSDLPPLPPGFDLGQLSQLGGASLEMAIRMGIEMGMKQQQLQIQTTPTLPSTLTSPPSLSVVTSPNSQNTSSPEKTRKGGRGAIVNNILHDDFLSTRAPPSTIASPIALPSFPASRRPSHGDVGESSFPEVQSPDEMAKKDPLASQVWKVYARDKGTMPNGARMENLTWRLMHLTLKQTQEREAREAAEAAAAAAAVAQAQAAREPALPPTPADQERGRSKGKSRVVGFQGASASPE